MKKMKRFAALALAATMVFGGTMTVLASSVSGTGTGSYEGDELAYPVASVTLPTIEDETYDYIADPNGLIALTKNEHYPDATFTGETGIFFETAENTYTEKSAALSAENKSAFNVEVSVTLTSAVPAGDIVYADSKEFAGEDQNLYLALVDDAETPNVAAITTTTGDSGLEVVPATLTTTVLGKPQNYKASWTGEENGYEYVFVDEEDKLVWNKSAFYITGALNTGADWVGEDGVIEFPEITVTWNVTPTETVPEVSDDGNSEGTPDVVTVPTADKTTVAGEGGVVTVSLPEGVELTKVERNSSTAGVFKTMETSRYSTSDIEGGVKITFNDTASTTVKLTFSEGDPITITLTH